MPVGRRLPTGVHKLIGRKWENDGDRIVEEKLRQLQDMGLGLPKLPITTKGDILVFTTVYDRLQIGADGLFLQADSNQVSGLNWVSIGDTDQNILANMIFGP